MGLIKHLSSLSIIAQIDQDIKVISSVMRTSVLFLQYRQLDSGHSDWFKTADGEHIRAALILISHVFTIR